MQRLLKGASVAVWLIAGPSSSLAQYAPDFDLTGLNGSNGFRFNGQSQDRRTGNAVANAGDFNGDGYDDLLVAAPLAKADGAVEAGEVAVIFGKKGAHPATATSAALDGKNGFRLKGFTPRMQVGLTLASAGDFNADGYDDILIGAPNAAPGGRSSAGMVFLLLGRKGGFPAAVHLDDFDGLAGTRFEGVRPGDKLGSSLAGAADFDADGFKDILLGASGYDPKPELANAGAAYVVYGRKGPLPPKLPFNVLGGNGASRVNGEWPAAALGNAVAVADFDTDGRDDMLLGSPYHIAAGEQKGRVYVVYGGPSRLDATMDVWDIDGLNGFMVSGYANFELFGWSAAVAGDVNGDHHKDFILGAPGYSLEGISSEGAAYVLFGNPRSSYERHNTASDLLSAGLLRRFTGRNPQDATGSTVAGGRDINGDGFSDVLIGAPGFDRSAAEVNAGTAYLVFGQAQGYPSGVTLRYLDGKTGFMFRGSANQSFAATGLAMLGDMNRDGLAELAIGAPQTQVGGLLRAGSAYVVNGLGPVSPVSREAWNNHATILGGNSNDGLFGSFRDDILEGRGGSDLLNGGRGFNIASYEHAAGPVTANLAAPSGNTGEAAVDTYAYIGGLRGSWHDDRLVGDEGSNSFAGLRGRDVMTGGGGTNTYYYYDVRDSRPGEARRDVITDFNPGTPTTRVDRIMLHEIDAKSGVDGRQPFTWIGTKGFSRRKGELRVTKLDGKVLAQADVTGDGRADFEIHFSNLKSTSNLDASDFVTGLTGSSRF